MVTVGRSDYGIYLPLLAKLRSDPEIQLRLLVSGMHLSPDFRMSVKGIEADGFEIAERIEMLVPSDTPEAISRSIGQGVAGFAQAYARSRPDLLVVLGDRFEMYAAALAALPFKIPVAHLHGGELTEGAFDDALRHSLTKFSHLHFVSTQEYARRVIQLGEEPWRVMFSGALSLDNLAAVTLLSVEELERRFPVKLDKPFLLVTFHPVTLEYERTDWHMDGLLAALGAAQMPAVLTLPNADTGRRTVLRRLQQFVGQNGAAKMVPNLGTQAYFSMMKLAAAMVGNSSSGIIEAPSFPLPVVNIGTRQQGRLRAANVIDVGYECEQVLQGIRKACSPEFRESLRNLVNPHYAGGAATRIAERLKTVPLDERLIAKRFQDCLPVDRPL